MMGTPEHYGVLGLPSDFSSTKLPPSSIRKAFRRKALTLHPDKNPSDPTSNARFQLLKSSYDVLIDPISRKLYHAQLLRTHGTRTGNTGESRRQRKEEAEMRKREMEEEMENVPDEKLEERVTNWRHFVGSFKPKNNCRREIRRRSWKFEQGACERQD